MAQLQRAYLTYRPFPHSNKQWCRIEVRVDKNMYGNVHPNLALVLLFVRTEVEYGKGLLTDWSLCYKSLVLRSLNDPSFTNRPFPHSHKQWHAEWRSGWTKI